MRKIFYTFLVVILFSSCGEYQKALKKDDVAEKFRVGTELYEAGKYAKANRLFHQIVPNYRGKPQGEKVTYMYANSHYMLKDYFMAAYQFERFEGAYPNSEKAEEALFLSTKSFYKLSPVYSKEQKETIEAIEKLQLFINKYPNSQYLSEANDMVRELDYKLEKKAYEVAKLYNKIAYYESSDYEAAIKAFDNFLIEYPGSSFRENAMFYRLDSAYKLAINSVEYKQEARLNTAIGFYNSFIRAYATSTHSSEANKMNSEMQTALQKFNTKS